MKKTIYVIGNPQLAEKLSEQLVDHEITQQTEQVFLSLKCSFSNSAIILSQEITEDSFLDMIGELTTSKRTIILLVRGENLITLHQGIGEITRIGAYQESLTLDRFPLDLKDPAGLIRKLSSMDLGLISNPNIMAIEGIALRNGRIMDRTVSLICNALESNFLKIEVEYLRKKDAVTSNFVDMFSHDIGLPLTSLKGNIELMLDGEYGEITAEQKNALKTMEKSTNKINDMRKESLYLNKFDSGVYRVNKKLTSIYSLLEDVMYEMMPMMERKEQVIELDTPHFSAFLDQEKMRHVLGNLLSNASKYSPNGTLIKISAVELDTNFQIRIRDNGIGIPEGMEEKIFERFVRIKKSSADGTGLGLSIVKTIVEKHGGRIWYERPESGGSEFVLEIPRA